MKVVLDMLDASKERWVEVPRERKIGSIYDDGDGKDGVGDGKIQWNCSDEAVDGCSPRDKGPFFFLSNSLPNIKSELSCKSITVS